MRDFIFIFFILAFIILCIILKKLFFGKQKRKKARHFPVKYPEDRNKDWVKDHYDVAVIGAGPAGATCAYYLGRAGWKVLLLEKKKFPRDKFCGDVVCKTAIEILMDMGIYDQLIKQNKAYVSDSGGICSPGGLSFIGRCRDGSGKIPAVLACKRIHLDQAIAMAAKRIGADLREECSVNEVKFDKTEGLWMIYLDNDTRTFTSRVLVCADGAQSRLGMKLGLVTKPPNGVCSRSYVEGGTHKFKADGVVFYNKQFLPGFSALFRHVHDELNFYCYIIPGNTQVKPEDLAYWHDYLMKNDPNISRALGKDFKMDTMKSASLRLGCEKKTFDDHLLLVGDAAGMIDPMMGEGIHHAMEGGMMAAQFLGEVISHGNYDREVMEIYQQRWMKKFGYDFKWSMICCQLVFRFPILLDAITAALQRKGEKLLLKWADIMTGGASKLILLRPEFSIVIMYELLRLAIGKLFGAKPKKME